MASGVLKRKRPMMDSDTDSDRVLRRWSQSDPFIDASKSPLSAPEERPLEALPTPIMSSPLSSRPDLDQAHRFIRPATPNHSSYDEVSATPSISPLRREYVFKHVFRRLEDDWQALIQDRGWYHGSPEVYNLRFKPLDQQVKNGCHERAIAIAIELPAASLPDVADRTEAAMLECFERRCAVAIRMDQAGRAKGGGLVKMARKRAEGIKQKVVEEAGQLDAESLLANMDSGSPPARQPQTPKRKRADSPTALVISMRNLNLNPNVKSGSPARPDPDFFGSPTKRSIRGMMLPPPPAAPSSTPRRYPRRRDPRYSHPSTPRSAAAVRKSRTPRSAIRAEGLMMEDIVGFMGSYPVCSPSPTRRGRDVAEKPSA
ncbi:hypothetical protein F4778DRAFT_743360 [Xylariomycetidae sp. FL2044]|nr:hypothetical protein F4778DRAFT_743360 [Xylariomycetidae sp. FL2044]